jgi:hypothetical protein
MILQKHQLSNRIILVRIDLFLERSQVLTQGWIISAETGDIYNGELMPIMILTDRLTKYIILSDYQVKLDILEASYIVNCDFLLHFYWKVWFIAAILAEYSSWRTYSQG